MADIESNIKFGVDTSDAMASIKMLQAQISAFQRQMASSSAANAESARKLRRGLLDDLAATGQWSTSIKTIKSSSESFTNALEKNKLSMGEYFRFAGASTKKFGSLFTTEFNTIEKVARERVKDLQTQYISLGRDANGALKAISVRPLKLDMNDLATQTAMTAQKQQIFNQLLKQGSTNLLNFGKNTQWAGRQLMVGFTIPLSIFGTQASKTFMELEEQAIRFKRVYGELFTPPAEADEMLDTLKELGKEFTKYGVAVEKTLGLAADAAAMGKTGTELLDQVTEATRLAVLGSVEQQKALETTISLTNAFGVATEDLASKIDFLNAVENQTVVSIEDLTIAIPKAGPVIKQLGGDVEELAFFLTAMKEGGINASEGANALKSGLASLINPTGVANTMLKTFGINIKEISAANRGDVKGLVIDFARALDELDPSQRAQAIEQLFGKFQFSRLSTLFKNVIEEGNQASRVLELTNATTKELAQLSSKELKRVEESTTFRFKKAVEEFQLAIAPVGEEFLKLITPIIEFATKIIEKFNSLSDGAKSFITGLTVLLGAVGPVALMTFGLLANGVANIIKSFVFLRDLFLKTGNQSKVLGEQIDYMTSEQLNAAAVAASLDQTHQQLIQTFSVEAGAVKNLADVYRQAFNEQQRFDTGRAIARQAGLKLASGIVSVPGPKGAGDIVPAMLSPGEAVIPAGMAKKYAPLIQGMISGNIPGFNKGVFLGMPRSGKSTGKNRDAAQQIYEMFLQSSYKNVPPTEYGHQIAPTSGHSFPIFGLGGVYMTPGGEKVFVKPVMDEKAALAEMRGTQIARQVHGLKAPEQRIVVIRDPQDPTRNRRFLALESKLDSTFVNNDPMAVFNEDQYFKQLVASLVRVDKDLSAGNVFGDVVADVGPAGVFTRASGVRDYAESLPSMEEQAMVNLLGIKGGAKRAFAESTLALMAGLTPQQYHQRMISEIQQVLPLLRQTVAGFGLTDPREVKVYDDMIRRLEQGLTVDWSKFHAIHSAVKPTSKPTQAASMAKVPGYADGVVSVPGPKGKGDVVPAMLSPGEAVIPAKMAQKYAPLINAMVSGNIPGYRNGLFSSQSSRFGQSGEASAQASHFGMFAPSEMTRTLKELGDELGDFTADIYILGEKLEDGTRKVEKANLNLSDFAGKASDLVAGGMTYSGTTTIESKDRNQAYNAAGIRGAAFTLEELAESGRLAKAALDSGSTASVRYARQLEEIVVEGQLAETALRSSNSQEKKLAFMRENARKALVESILSQTKVKNVGEAQALAADKLTAVQVEIAKLEASGMDEELLLQEAKKKYAAMLIRSGSGEFAVGPAGTGGSELRDVATGRGRSNLRREFGPGEDPLSRKFASGGRSTAAVSSALFIEVQKRVEDEVSALLEVVGSAAMSAIKQGLGIASPSKEFENVSKGVSDGVRKGQDDAIVAGEDVGEAAAAGMRKAIDDAAIAGEAVAMAGANGFVKIGRRVTNNPDIINAAREQANAQSQSQSITPRGPRRATSGGTATIDPATGAYVVAANAAARATQDLAEKTAETTRTTQASTDKLARMNSVLMNGTFAITSLAGAGIMMDGAIGEVSNKIFQFSGILFGLMQVTQLLTQAKLAELAATRISVAKIAMARQIALAKRAGETVKPLALFARGLAAAITPMGFFVLGLAAIGGGIALLLKIQEDQKKATNALADATFLSAEKIKKAGDLLGFEAKTFAFGENVVGTASARTSEEASLISQLRSSDDFKDTYKNEIDAIRQATNEQAELALTAVANQLFASGAAKEQVDAYVRAIAQEAGKTTLSLEFASIDFGTAGATQIVSFAKNASEAYANAFADNIQVRFTSEGTLIPEMTSYGDKGLAAVKTFAASMASSFQSLKDGLANGLITADQFQDGLSGVVGELNNLDSAALQIVLPDLYKELNIEETMNKIPGLSDQLLMLQLMASGISVPQQYLDALANADSSDGGAQRAAQRARREINRLLREEVEERERIADLEEQSELINEAVGAANVSLAERTTQLENQRIAYNALVDAGFDAAEAFDAVGDATLAAGIAAALADGALEGSFEGIIEQYKAFKAAEKNAPTNPSGSGTAEKTPLQQATEQLKEQREELLNTSAAYSKLRDAGFSVKDAMLAAEDPILAAALATTKVGTKAWNTLVQKIQQVTNLLNNKELQDLLKTGKIEIDDKRSQIAVSSALDALGWSFESIQEVLSDQEFTNTLAKDLEDGVINSKSLLYRLAQIKKLEGLDVELNFTTKEGAADEFQKRYDKVVGSLEAQKQVIEIDFKVKTRADEQIARAAENQIAALQFEMDDYEAGLTRLEKDEKAINDEYDDRKEALDAIAKLNEEIANKQKSQLDIASALSRGDVAAAARASQEMRAKAQQDAIKAQQDRLELSRERKLKSLTTDVNGQALSREQIEQNIADIKEKIFNIEEDTLEPARERIRLAGVEKDAATTSLDAQILKWEQLSAKVNAAKLSLTPEEISAMETQAGLIADLLENWNKIEDRRAILTIIKKTLGQEEPKPEDKPKPKEKEPDPKKPGLKDTGTVTAAARTPTTEKPLIPTGGSLVGNKTIAPITEAEKQKTSSSSGSFVIGPDGRPVINGVAAGGQTPKANTTPAVNTALAKDKAGLNIPAKKVAEPLVKDGSSPTVKVAAAGKSAVASAVVNAAKSLGSVLQVGKTVGKVFAMATGGKVSGPGTGTSDSIPAMLSNGEYVIKASSVRNLGVDFLDFLNQTGQLPGFAKGGFIIPDRPTSGTKKSTPKPTVAPKVDVRAAMAADKKATSKNIKDLKPTLSSPAPISTMGQDFVGKGLKAVFNEVTKSLFGDAVANARSGRAVSGSDVANSALTVGLNSLPIPAAVGVKNLAKGATTSVDNLMVRAVATSLLKNQKTAQVVPDSALNKILKDREIKNAFQAGEKKAAWDNMKMVERDTLGIPLNAADSLRPVYQYLTTGRNIPEFILKGLPPKTANLLRATNLINKKALAGFGASSGKTLLFTGNKPGATFTLGDSAYRGVGLSTLGNGRFYLNNTDDAIQQLSAVGKKLPFIEVQTPQNIGLFSQMGVVRGSAASIMRQHSLNIKDKIMRDLYNRRRRVGINRNPADEFGNRLADGGLVKPAYLRMGGLLPYKSEGGQIFKPLGTDKVPAMLTPGEFVVSRPAVQNYGVEKLRAINSGTYSGDSVYNYNLSVNVKSEANPDQIAKAVMTQIKQVDSMRLRGNRF